MRAAIKIEHKELPITTVITTASTSIDVDRSGHHYGKRHWSSLHWALVIQATATLVSLTLGLYLATEWLGTWQSLARLVQIGSAMEPGSLGRDCMQGFGL